MLNFKTVANELIMVKFLKIFSIIVYFLITLPDAHYKVNFISLLIIATTSGNVFIAIAALLILTPILLLIWTVIKPNNERDKVLVPIIALILNIPIGVIMFNGLFHPAYFNHKDFLIPAILFLILTIIFTKLTLRNNERILRMQTTNRPFDIKLFDIGEIRMGSPYNLCNIKLVGTNIKLPKAQWQDKFVWSEDSKRLVLIKWNLDNNEPGFHLFLIDTQNRKTLESPRIFGLVDNISIVEDIVKYRKFLNGNIKEEEYQFHWDS